MGPQNHIQCVAASCPPNRDDTDSTTFSGFVVIFGLIWAVLLSVYLSKAWSHSTTLQRGSSFLPIEFLLTHATGAIVLAIICVDGFSSLLLYLM